MRNIARALALVLALPVLAAAAKPEKPGRGGKTAPEVSASTQVFVRRSTEPLTVADVLDQFELYDEKLTSLTARFTQSLTMTETGLTSAVEGTVAYLKPERLRIEHIRPERQTVVTDGKDIWIHRYSRAQVIQSKLEDWKQSDPTVNNLMQFGSYAKMMRSYDVELDTGTMGRPALILRPKERGHDFELRLELEPENLFPSRAELRVQSMRIRTAFEDIALNPPVDEKQFRFSPPPGVDVFRDFKPPRFEP